MRLSENLAYVCDEGLQWGASSLYDNFGHHMIEHVSWSNEMIYLIMWTMKLAYEAKTLIKSRLIWAISSPLLLIVA